MNTRDPIRETEVFFDVALVLAILLSGGVTAFTLHSLLTPLPGGSQRIDVVDELRTMAFVLNGVLPLAVAALAVSTGIKLRRRSLNLLTLSLSVAALVGVMGCALATYAAMAAAHPDPGVLPRIWWRFASS